MAIATSILGFPRIGARRELKFAQEGFWSGKIDAAALQSCAQAIRLMNWRTLAQRGLSTLPSNDFSLYDQMLDTSVMLGAIPAVYGWRGGAVGLDTYFAMARGTRGESSVPALEMTKWFDTNYHYLVPELN
jgi:5-methyltetrahydropteroyltriglutamate--homocysteine methyltransferase